MAGASATSTLTTQSATVSAVKQLALTRTVVSALHFSFDKMDITKKYDIKGTINKHKKDGGAQNKKQIKGKTKEK